MQQVLYLTLERGRRYYQPVRIVKVSKKKPQLKKPTEQAILKLVLNIPDRALEPPVVRVDILPEHIRPPETKVCSQPI